MEDAEHVDVEHAREDLLVVLGDVRDLAEHAGVGERDVEAAEPLQGQRDRRPHGLRVRHVGHGAHGADLLGDAVDRAVDVGEHDVRAVGDERARGGRADRPRASGDERDLPGKLHASISRSTSTR
jgi:hypothetical protein